MLRTNFEGDPNLGLYGFATDKYCIIGVNSARKKVEGELKVKTYFFSVFNTSLLGIFGAGNSTGMVMPSIIEKEEKEQIKIETLYIESRYTAFGNLILMNDNGIILSPLLKNEKEKIEKFFGLESHIMKIAGTSIVGNAGIATNKGCLLHPKAKESEIKKIESVLGVSADIGTVNFGSSYTGAGIIANSNGYIVSERCSGPELGRITEALGFL